MRPFLQAAHIHWLIPVTFALFYGATEAASPLAAWAFGLHAADPSLDSFRDLRGPMLVIAAGLYAAYRMFAFHPLYVAGYRQFLAATPWTSRDPLPLGPVLPVLQDLLIVAGLSVLAWWRSDTDPLAVWISALGVYAGISVGPMADLDRSLEIGLMICLAPLVLLAWGSMPLELPVAATLFALALIGVSRGLQRLPWLEPRRKTVPVPLGWPFASLVDPGPPARPRGLGPYLGLLAGWWAFGAARALDIDSFFPADHAANVVLAAGVLFAGWRTLTFTLGYLPPITLWARLATGRLIIPGYDVIFVGPICTILTAILVGQALRLLGAPSSFIIGLGIAAALAVSIDAGPGLRTWRLTGHHRVRPMNVSRCIRA